MHWLKGFVGYLGLTAAACGGSGTAAKAANAGSGAENEGGSVEAGGNSNAGSSQPDGGATSAGSNSSGASSNTSGSNNASAGGPPVSHACDSPNFTCTASGSLPSGAPALSAGTWVNISPKGVPFGDGGAFTQGLAVDPCDPATIYLTVDGFDVSGTKAGLYKTTDGGSSWKKISLLDEPIKVRIDPKNPQHLYVVDGVRGGSEGFWVSCDGGETFFTPTGFAKLKDDPGMFQYDTYDVAVDPSDFNHLLVSNHGAWGWTDTKWNTNSGVLESKDGGASWIVHEPMQGWGTGHAINFLYNPALKVGNSDTWLLGTQGPGMFKTTDAGKTWKKVSAEGIQHGGGSVYYDKAGTLYASGASANLRSSDNGETWTQVSDAKVYNAIYGDGTLLYTAPGFGPSTFFTTPEGGNGTTWTALGTQQFKEGPFEMAMDRKNRVLYTASWGDGLWALKL
jgi:photosystem II stability/assembly factor-like uncharacterized protein